MISKATIWRYRFAPL